MNEEDRIRRAFVDTGWKVRWNDGWLWDIVGRDKIRTGYKSVVLESPGGEVLVNAGTTVSSAADRYGRDYVFATAGADMSGAVRPHGKIWINAAGYLVGVGGLDVPKWYGDGGGVYRFVTVRPGVNVENDSGEITTRTITDTNKNQTRQTVYQPRPAEVINIFMSRADLIHRWSFNGNLDDAGSIGGKTAVLGAAAALTDDGTSVRLTRGDGGSYVELGADPIPSGLGDTPFTIEVWATPTTLDTYRGMFSLGARDDNNAKGLMGVFQGYRQVREGGETESGPVWQAVAGNLIKKDGTSAGTGQNVAMTYGNISANTPYYFAYVVTPKGDGDSATVAGYVYDAAERALVGKSLEYTVTGWTTALLDQSWFGLGTTPWGDAAPGADYDEVRVWKKALTAEQIAANVAAGPDAVFQ